MEEIVVISVEKFKEIIADCLAESRKESQHPDPPCDDGQFLRNIQELAEFLGCSSTTAQKFKNQNRNIFLHVGRKFIVKESDVIEALKCKSRYPKR